MRVAREREPSRRGDPRTAAPPPDPDPAPPRRGPARRHDRFLLIPIAVIALLAIVVVVFKAQSNSEPSRRDPRWNAPARHDRRAPLANLIEQATVRGDKLVPGARLARLAIRHVAPDGTVDMNFGSVDVVLVAPGARGDDGAPCGVELSVSWHGWRQKLEQACDGATLVMRCAIGDVLARAFDGAPPDDAVAELAPATADERAGRPADLGAWLVRTAPREPARRVLDDCGL